MSLCDKCENSFEHCPVEWQNDGCEFFHERTEEDDAIYSVDAVIHPETYIPIEASEYSDDYDNVLPVDETDHKFDRYYNSAVNPSHYTSGPTQSGKKTEMICDALDKYGRIRGINYGYLFNIFKYYDRMGKKDGEPIEKDAIKCANYVHALLTGEWFK